MNLTKSNERLERLAQEYWQFECEERPVSAIMAGQTPSLDVLFRESDTDYGRRAVRSAKLETVLDGINTDGLVPQDLATWRLLKHEFTIAREEMTTTAHRRPSIFPFGPEYSAVYYANTVTITDAEAAERYASRLATVPEYFGDVTANLIAGYESGIRYPAVLLSQAAGNIQAMLATPTEQTPWMKPFRDPAVRSPRIDTAAERVRVLIERELRTALAHYLETLQSRLAVGARTTFSCVDAPEGHAFYLSQIHRYGTLELSPEAIHQRGIDEVARLTDAMEKIAGQAGYGGRLKDYRRFLESDPQFVAPSARALRERAESLAKRIDKRIPVFFGRIPRITYGIETVPEAISSRMPIAYAQPNPANGSAAGIFWLTAFPDRCPLYALPTYVAHEAWPGHLMHIALMQEMKALPAFRRHGALKYSACLEGWAVYCESLGSEMGLYDTPPEHFGRINSELWRAARLVVDTGIHWYGWARERAVEYLSTHVSLSAEAVTAEVDRYAALPAQALAYYLGLDTVRRLRAKAERILADRFNLRHFHDAVIGAGPVTLPVWEELLDGWLMRQ
jgi:uncharacterized protein (DUF885 family)